MNVFFKIDECILVISESPSMLKNVLILIICTLGYLRPICYIIDLVLLLLCWGEIKNILSVCQKIFQFHPQPVSLCTVWEVWATNPGDCPRFTKEILSQSLLHQIITWIISVFTHWMEIFLKHTCFNIATDKNTELLCKIHTNYSEYSIFFFEESFLS